MIHESLARERERSHADFLRCLSPFKRALIWSLSRLFMVCFRKRWRLSVEHIERSSLQLRGERARRLARCALEQLGLTVIDAVTRSLRLDNRVIEVSGETLRDRLCVLRERGVCIEGLERLLTAFNAGRGVVVVSAHLGAWEDLMRLGQWLGRPVYVISKQMKSRLAQHLWDRSRRQAPARLDRGARGRIAAKTLRSGGVIADVLDQHDPRPRAITLNFLGREAQTSGDLARLALMSDALIVPLFLLRGDVGIEGQRCEAKEGAQASRLSLLVGDVIDARDYRELPHSEAVKAISQSCLHNIERAILRAPEQWMWLHRRWKPRQ